MGFLSPGLHLPFSNVPDAHFSALLKLLLKLEQKKWVGSGESPKLVWKLIWMGLMWSPVINLPVYFTTFYPIKNFGGENWGFGVKLIKRPGHWLISRKELLHDELLKKAGPKLFRWQMRTHEWNAFISGGQFGFSIAACLDNIGNKISN